MSLDFLTRHDQRRIICEVLCIMLVGIWGIGRGVEVLEEGFEVWIEVQFRGFEVVLAHIDGVVLMFGKSQFLLMDI